MVFGDALVVEFAKRVEVMDLAFAGIVARPLYACVQCGDVASMSPLLVLQGERKEWRCAKCRQNGAPVSDSVPRRTLRLYPLVRTLKGQVTPMRRRPIIALVFVPPVEFSWGKGVGATFHQALPVKKVASGRVVFQDEEGESEAIWLTAKCFKGASL